VERLPKMFTRLSQISACMFIAAFFLLTKKQDPNEHQVENVSETPLGDIDSEASLN